MSNLIYDPKYEIRNEKRLQIHESVNPDQIGVSDGDLETFFIESEEPSISFGKDEISILLKLVNNIIYIIEDTDNGNQSNNKLALGYLKDIRDEIKSSKPKWKNIANGLIVVMALVSGIAVAPMAMDKIDKAIKIVVEKNRINN